jgi:hypothetical protein
MNPDYFYWLPTYRKNLQSLQTENLKSLASPLILPEKALYSGISYARHARDRFANFAKTPENAPLLGLAACRRAAFRDSQFARTRRAAKAARRTTR